VPAGRIENGIVSGLDWFPTFAAAAGYQGDIAARTLGRASNSPIALTKCTSTAKTRWTCSPARARPPGGRTSGQFIGQLALADTGFTAQKEESPAARAGIVETSNQLCQFTLSSDE
jgi:arylsulfatase A-like enzyme